MEHQEGVPPLEKALTEEGVGGKTAVGYGLFKIDGDSYDEPKSIKDLLEKKKKKGRAK